MDEQTNTKAQYRRAYSYLRLKRNYENFQSVRDYTGWVGCSCKDRDCPYRSQCERSADEQDEQALWLQREVKFGMQSFLTIPENVRAAALQAHKIRYETPNIYQRHASQRDKVARSGYGSNLYRDALRSDNPAGFIREHSPYSRRND